MTIISSGGLAAKLLDEASRCVGELRSFTLPVGKPLHIYAQPLTAFGRFRIVKADALDKASVARVPVL
jgi:hypothetical protein